MSRLGAYSIREGDSVVRNYSMGTEACDMIVRLARAGRISADIETDGLAEDSYTVKVISAADDTHTAVLDAFNPKHVQAARDAFEIASEIVFHNSPFDVPPMVHCGAMSADHIWKITDTMIWARMARSDQLGGKDLETLEKSVLGATDGTAEKDRFSQWATINKYNSTEKWKAARYGDKAYSMYAGWDTIITYRLYEPLLKEVIDLYTNHPFGRFGADRALAEKLAWREQIVNRIMLRRSAKGLDVDLGLLQREQDKLAEEQADLADGMRNFGIESPTNGNELIGVLVKAEALPKNYPVTGKKKLPSTAAVDLKKLTHPAAKLYHSYAERNKLFSYYEKARILAERTDGRLHPVVGVCAAVTGRMSYANPALQQFLPAAREAVLGDYDLTSLDFSQIEPVLAANLSGDTAALDIYEGSGDLYQAAVRAGGVTRKQGKEVILAGMFGQGLKALMAKLNSASLEETEEIREEVNKGMPRTGRLIGWAMEIAAEAGCVFTLSGRIVPVPAGFDYRGMNYMIQPSAYDVIAENLVTAKERGISDEIHLVMHDEFIISKHVADEMQDIMNTPPPRLVEIIERTPVIRTDRAELKERWRTLPKTGADCCGSEQTVRWDGDKWLCGVH